MNCSVNLVPVAQMLGHTRSRRKKAWFGVCLGAALLVVAGWALDRAAARDLRRVRDHVDALQARRSEVQRQIVAARAARATLAAQLETVARAGRAQPWPQRLITLARRAPAGVFLTQLSVITPETEPTPGGAAAPSPSHQAVTLLGYAVDHAVLIELLNTLQDLPDWQQVKLGRATLEPLGDGLAVAFEVEARTQETAP